MKSIIFSVALFLISAFFPLYKADAAITCTSTCMNCQSNPDGSCTWTCPSGYTEGTPNCSDPDTTVKCEAKCNNCTNGPDICFKCIPPKNTPTPTPTLTPTPPQRQYLCLSAATTKSVMVPGDTTRLTSEFTHNVASSFVKEFWYAFYNYDNLYGPNNPKPICVTSNVGITNVLSGCPKVNGVQSHQLIYKGTRNSANLWKGHVDLTYSQIFVKDLNNAGKVPSKVGFNAYFLDKNGMLSDPDIKCKGTITRSAIITETPTPTRTITPTPSFPPPITPPTRTPTKTPTPSVPGSVPPSPPRMTPTPTITPTPPPPITGCINFGIDEYSNGKCFNVLKIRVVPSPSIAKMKTYWCNPDNICNGESMDATTPRSDGIVYLSAGESPSLYSLNKSTGVLTRKTSLSRIYEGLSFRIQDGTGIVWGGSLSNGIDKIDRTNGQVKKHYAPSNLSVTLRIKSMVWNNTGTYLYVSHQSADRCTQLITLKYQNDALSQEGTPRNMPGCGSGRTDAMDITADGYIVGGYKSGTNLVFYFLNPGTGAQVGTNKTIPLSSYNASLLNSQPQCAQSFTNLDAFAWLCGNKP